MKSIPSFLIGAAEVAVGAYLIPPMPEDFLTGGATIAPTAVVGLFLLNDGLRRLG